jgi:hypothetical protein
VSTRLLLLLLAVSAAALGQQSDNDDETSAIFRVWTPRGRTETVELPLTERAREAVLAYDVPQDDAAPGCESPPGMPVMLNTSLAIEFVARGDQILMRFAEWDAERTIYMNPRNGPPVQEHSPMGVSFGRWEGQTLAVFTTYISYPYFDDRSTPQSTAVTVLERYTPSEQGTRLDWRVAVTDPATFTTPVVRDGHMEAAPQGMPLPLPPVCSEPVVP